MQSAYGQSRRAHEEVLAPVRQSGSELQIAAQRFHFVAIARSIDRGDEAVDRAVPDEGRRGLGQIHLEVAREPLFGALHDRVPDDVPGLELTLVCETLQAGCAFDPASGAEGILREQAAVADGLYFAQDLVDVR